MLSGNEIFGKSEDGRREMQSRQRKLPAKARVLLIAIDGHSSTQQLREDFASLGDVDALIETLVREGLIVAEGVTSSTSGAAPKTTTTSVSDATQRFILAQKFMNETAVEALGLRAFLFTLKLERCASVADLRALLPEYDRVLAKARDQNLLRAYHAQLENWLR